MGLMNKLFGGGAKQGGGQKLIEMVQMLQQDLNLSSDQMQKIQGFIQQFKTDRNQIKTAGGNKSQIKDERKELKDQIMSILNDEQKQKLVANIMKYRETLIGE